MTYKTSTNLSWQVSENQFHIHKYRNGYALQLYLPAQDDENCPDYWVYQEDDNSETFTITNKPHVLEVDKGQDLKIITDRFKQIFKYAIYQYKSTQPEHIKTITI